MEEFAARYAEVLVRPEQAAAARALKPVHERQVFGQSILLFDGIERKRVAEFEKYGHRALRICLWL